MGTTCKLGKKNKKHQDKIRKLAKNVTDKEIEKFVCEIPSEEDMDRGYFPNPSVKSKSLEWLSQNMLIGCEEWGEAWLVVVKEEKIDDDNFSILPEEKKIKYRNRMEEIARSSRRVVLYKKWRYALEKVCKEKNERLKAKEENERQQVKEQHEEQKVNEKDGGQTTSWDDKWDDDWSTGIVLGGAAVGGDGNREHEYKEREGKKTPQEELTATSEGNDVEDDEAEAQKEKSSRLRAKMTRMVESF